MLEKKINEKVTESTWDMFKSLQEANTAMVDSAVATQERNLQYAQSMLMSGAEVFKSHGENSAALIQELMTLFYKQQEIFQSLVTTSMEAYVAFLYRPLSYYKERMEAVEMAVK